MASVVQFWRSGVEDNHGEKNDTKFLNYSKQTHILI
jgi:hypothetical protein